MKYILVKNKTEIILGPIFWRPRQFQEELDDLEVDFQLSPLETDYVNIDNVYEIFPVVQHIMPEMDERYEEPVGPTYTFNNNEATETYTKKYKDIEIIKDKLKQVVARRRYEKEITGIVVTVNSLDYTLLTTETERAKQLYKLSLMNDGDTVKWKFPERWTILTKAQLNTVIRLGNNHIQAQFDWEKDVDDAIDAATTLQQLRDIVIAEDLFPNRQL